MIIVLMIINNDDTISDNDADNNDDNNSDYDNCSNTSNFIFLIGINKQVLTYLSRAPPY